MNTSDGVEETLVDEFTRLIAHSDVAISPQQILLETIEEVRRLLFEEAYMSYGNYTLIGLDFSCIASKHKTLVIPILNLLTFYGCFSEENSRRHIEKITGMPDIHYEGESHGVLLRDRENQEVLEGQINMVYKVLKSRIPAPCDVNPMKLLGKMGIEPDDDFLDICMNLGICSDIARQITNAFSQLRPFTFSLIPSINTDSNETLEFSYLGDGNRPYGMKNFVLFVIENCYIRNTSESRSGETTTNLELYNFRLDLSEDENRSQIEPSPYDIHLTERNVKKYLFMCVKSMNFDVGTSALLKSYINSPEGKTLLVECPDAYHAFNSHTEGTIENIFLELAHLLWMYEDADDLMISVKRLENTHK